ncbi:hypothetical protein chiPu_0020610 [Chiloscyllium punctatum]|uniref:PAS domain-containing protein n=1 Tax=Chiloscyllium punctatum TaxID=137246 RepID=A0A401RHG5_CHIPU|nr:hypothetical protein [Chiloscyllium punctatum]
MQVFLSVSGDSEQGPGCLLGLSSELDSLLDGFLLLLSQSGKVTFTGENVHRYLGLTQLELMGQNIFDFVHPYDQRELQEALMFKQVDGQKTNRRESRDFFIRVKCTVTNDSKMVNLRLASWKVLHCSGFFWTPQGNRRVDTRPYLILICDPIPFPLNLEPSAKGQSFLTYHSLDMKFIYCDSRVKDLIGFDADQLVGHSIYSFIHTFDLSHIWKRHFSLLKMGQISSGLYRMLHYFGGYIWVQTEATLVYENQNTRSPFVICNNYILSRPEQEEILFSIEQTKSDTGGRGLPTATVLPRDAKCAHIGPRHRLDQQGHQPCEVSETEALEVGITGMQWSYQHHNLQHPLSSTDAVPQSQRLAFENSRLLGLVSGAALTNPTLTSFRNMTLRPSTLFSAASSSNLTEEWFADHNLENLAPFIPMEDEEFQMIPVENSWLRDVPGYQTLHHRGNCETARFSSSSVCELSLRRGIKRNHQTDLTCDLAVSNLQLNSLADQLTKQWELPAEELRVEPHHSDQLSLSGLSLVLVVCLAVILGSACMMRRQVIMANTNNNKSVGGRRRSI